MMLIKLSGIKINNQFKSADSVSITQWDLRMSYAVDDDLR